MVWCSYCAKDQETESDDVNGFTCCTGCGRVLDDNIYSTDPTFTKTADGQSQAQGNFIKDRQYSSYGRNGESGSQYGYATDSHERTLEKGRNEIRDIADFLAMSGKEDVIGAAHRLYTLALERNFTRGRRTNQVAAACLYIICRQDQKPFLLIDFSDCLQTNVYILGGVFLQLCRLLSLEQHPIMQKVVDPSLFIHRFTDRLVGRTAGHGKKFHSIANTALRLVASMKRDWMQTGRRPSGICGAALYISAHIHGFECTKTDVISVVHICEGTLTKRLIEFEQTESGSLTSEEFDARAKEYEMLSQTITAPKTVADNDSKREVLCEHKDTGAAHFAVGLCQSCFEEFVRCSGGMQGGAEPPAFQASERKKLEEQQKKKEKEQLLVVESNRQSVLNKGVKRGRGRPKGNQSSAAIGSFTVKGKRTKRRRKGRECLEDTDVVDEYQSTAKPRDDAIVPSDQQELNLGQAGGLEHENLMEEEVSKPTSACLGNEADTVLASASLGGEASNVMDDLCMQKCSPTPRGIIEPKDTIVQDWNDAFLEMAAKDGEETLSDIDDSEVDMYLHNHEEIRLKTIIWTEMNKDYLQKQQAKQEALTAIQAAQAAALAAGGADAASALELASATAAAVAELKKDRKRKRVEAKNKGPAESAMEATRQMLESKSFSSKVNYGALNKLFDGEDAAETTNGMGKTKCENEATLDTKERHVKWADDGTGSKGDAVNSNKDGLKGQEDETRKDESEEEDFQDDDKTNVEEGNQFTNYEMPYGEDDGYDEYDEY